MHQRIGGWPHWRRWPTQAPALMLIWGPSVNGKMYEMAMAMAPRSRSRESWGTAEPRCLRECIGLFLFLFWAQYAGASWKKACRCWWAIYIRSCSALKRAARCSWWPGSNPTSARMRFGEGLSSSIGWTCGSLGGLFSRAHRDEFEGLESALLTPALTKRRPCCSWA